jgi:acyl-CoA thioesterase
MRLHGGYAATLIDSATGCAVQTKLQAGVGYGTIELKVNYVRKIDAEVGRLLCTGTVIHAGRTMLTADAKLTDENGKLYAHGSGTFLVYPQ